ncbi:MAG: sulfate transporter CysZ [Gammaproteobacteria bacterium]|nr:sulfate transporter CysZ [Gammaproteobacteria bacterium]
MKNDFSDGFSYLFKGLMLLNKPGIRIFVIIPLLINILIFSSVFGVAGYYFTEGLDYLLSKLPEWLSFLYWVIMPLFASAVLFIVGYTFNIVANIIGAPFNGFLAEKIEEHLRGNRPPETMGFTELIAIIPHSLKREFDKLAYYLPRLLLLILLTLIPGLNILAPFMWFVMGAWMLAIQYSDFPMDNNKISFAEMKRLLKQERLNSIGFGTTVAIALSIPVINFLVMPAAVAGATVMWVEKHQNQL